MARAGLTDMGSSVLALILGLVATGCLGEHIVISGENGPPSPRTSVVLTAPVGVPYRSQAIARAHCPSLPGEATCRAVRFHIAGRAQWFLLVDRNLGCGGVQGDYPNNVAACRALGVLLHGLRAKKREYCPCPLELGPRYTIRGRYRLHDLTLRFHICAALCGAPTGTSAAFQVLFPRAT